MLIEHTPICHWSDKRINSASNSCHWMSQSCYAGLRFPKRMFCFKINTNSVFAFFSRINNNNKKSLLAVKIFIILAGNTNFSFKLEYEKVTTHITFKPTHSAPVGLTVLLVIRVYVVRNPMRPYVIIVQI